MVLGTNFWPLNPAQTDYAVPREIQGSYERFTKYHGEMHSYVSRTCTAAIIDIHLAGASSRGFGMSPRPSSGRHTSLRDTSS